MSNLDIIINAFQVNNSAQAIITKINPNEKVIQDMHFFIQNAILSNHEILVIENTAQRAINIPANILSNKVFQNLFSVFHTHISLNFSVISCGVNEDILMLLSQIKAE